MQSWILLLASTMGVALGKVAYKVPPQLLAVADDRSNDCVLPANYFVRDFVGRSNNTSTTLLAFDFTFVDTTRPDSTTKCHFDKNSVSTTPSGLTPRYSCENREIKFIWDDPIRKLWMIQRVCPNADGIPSFEASGSVLIPLVCNQDKGTCAANQTEFESLFTSLQPVRDPTVVG